jgi:poly(A) polymerase
MCESNLESCAFEIVRRLRESGYRAFIVGGAVRDMIMGNTPGDYDIATSASPEAVSSIFEKTYNVGAKFGVTLVALGGHMFEVAMFRTEGDYQDGRRPGNVMPATETEDVMRRDFTINALLYDPETSGIIDYVSGRRDITDKIIRTIGNPVIRFREDRLRMLRALRFAARFCFTIEEETMAAIISEAEGINAISAERIGEELSKIFSGHNPEMALELLDRTGFLKILLPEVSDMKGVEQPPNFHPEGDVFNHTKLMLKYFGGGSSTLAFGILMHDVGKPQTATFSDRIRFNRHEEKGAEIAFEIMKRFKFGNRFISRVQTLVKTHMSFQNVPNMKKSTLKRLISKPEFDEMLELHRLDCLASHGNLSIYEFLKNKISEPGIEGIKSRLPDALINGDDLIDLGYKPGSEFKDILDKVMDAQLEGTVEKKEEAIAFVLRMFPVNLL